MAPREIKTYRDSACRIMRKEILGRTLPSETVVLASFEVDMIVLLAR
jgi:hypothetical protein